MADINFVKVGGRMHSTSEDSNPANNHVTSGANEIYDDAKGKKQNVINQETDEALADRYTKAQTYNKAELNNMITTPDQQYVTVATYSALPASGSADTVYRVSNWDGTQQDPTVYSEYAWNGSQYVHLSTKTQIGEVFDISAYHATGGELAKYADLSAALGTNGVNVPESLRKGGMSVKYVQSSDNKYVQYRYMLEYANTTAGNQAFLNTANWQGIDVNPTSGSKNLVESRGIRENIFPKLIWENGYIFYTNGTPQSSTAYRMTGFIPVSPNKEYFCNCIIADNAGIAFYDEDQEYISGINSITDNNVTIPDGAYFIRLSTRYIIGTFEKTDFYCKEDRYCSIANEGGLVALKGKIQKELFPILVWENGYIAYTSGNPHSTTAYRMTDFILVSPYKDYFCNCVIGGNAGIAFYNVYKEYISGINSITNNNVTIPDGAYFVRLSTQYDASTFKKISFYCKTDRYSGIANEGEVIELENLKLVFSNGYIFYTNGTVISSTAYRCTLEYIPILGGKEYICNASLIGNAGLAYYDVRKKYISGINSITDKKITTPANARYLRLSHNSTITNGVYLRLSSANISEQFVSKSEFETKFNSYNDIIIKNDNKNQELLLPSNAEILNAVGESVSISENYGLDGKVVKIPLNIPFEVKNSVIRFRVKFNDDLNKRSNDIDYTSENPVALNFFSAVSENGTHKINIGVLPDYLKNADTKEGYEDYGLIVGVQGQTQIKAVNASNVADDTYSDKLIYNNMEYRLLAGAPMFSIKWLDNTEENKDVCMKNDGTTLSFYHSTDDSVISQYTLSNYQTLTALYDALSADSNIEVKIYTLIDRTPDNLMLFEGIRLVSKRTVVDGNNYLGGTYPTKVVYDNAPITLYDKIDDRWHTVEIAAKSTINSGVYCICVDGHYLYAAGERISYILNPTLYFGGDSNGAKINCSIKDIEIKYNYPEDTEVVSYTNSVKALIISSWHPKVYAIEGHAMIDDIPDSDYGSIPSTHTYDRVNELFERLVAKGYVPITLDDFDKYAHEGVIPYKRAFITIYDDYQYNMYLNHRFNNLHKRYGVHPSLAEITTQDTYEYDGTLYNVKDINDLMALDDWLPMSHTRHQDYQKFGYADLVNAMENNISDARRLHIPSRGIVWPGGGCSIMNADVARDYGWSYGFGIYRSIARQAVYNGIKVCDNPMFYPRYVISNSVSLGFLTEIL